MEEIFLCSGCRSTRYCSESCQKEHWANEHKHKCKELNERRLNLKKPAAAVAEEEEPVDEPLVVAAVVVICASCGANDPSKQCSRCEKVMYCNRECQVAHWGQHKSDCQK